MLSLVTLLCGLAIMAALPVAVASPHYSAMWPATVAWPFPASPPLLGSTAVSMACPLWLSWWPRLLADAFPLWLPLWPCLSCWSSWWPSLSMLSSYMRAVGPCSPLARANPQSHQRLCPPPHPVFGVSLDSQTSSSLGGSGCRKSQHFQRLEDIWVRPELCITSPTILFFSNLD